MRGIVGIINLCGREARLALPGAIESITEACTRSSIEYYYCYLCVNQGDLEDFQYTDHIFNFSIFLGSLGGTYCFRLVA